MVYNTRGTCASQIIFEIENDIVKNVRFVGGCPGNAIGVSKLVNEMKIEEVIAKLKGIQCHNGTSCPDQLAKALEKFVEDNKK